MATSTMNFRVDEHLKNQAQIIVDGYGLSFSQVFKMFLNQMVNTGEIPLSLNYNAKTYRPEVVAELLEIRATERTPKICRNNQELIDMIKAD